MNLIWIGRYLHLENLTATYKKRMANSCAWNHEILCRRVNYNILCSYHNRLLTYILTTYNDLLPCSPPTVSSVFGATELRLRCWYQRRNIQFCSPLTMHKQHVGHMAEHLSGAWAADLPLSAQVYFLWQHPLPLTSFSARSAPFPLCSALTCTDVIKAHDAFVDIFQ